MKIEWELRRDVVHFGRLLYERRLTAGTSGNISARVNEGTMLITPTGACKGMLREFDLIKVDIASGRTMSEGRPSMETPFHLAAYRARKDVGAVIHCHPVFATVLACSNVAPRTDLTPEGLMVLKDVPVVPYATPGSEDLARNIQTALGGANACLLENHGAMAVGRSMEEAYYRIETLETMSELTVRCEHYKGLRPLPPDEKTRILDMMKEK
ncbi:MAG TPA: class II aldolase/adducin family protein [Methanomassiliicoccales archaeon]|nr:class II aldolase/adducin family protein [Methanomassiliicoccales archaeon]